MTDHVAGAERAPERRDADYFKAGLRRAVTWLHDRAKWMNDATAAQHMNSAATNLGWEIDKLTAPSRADLSRAPADGRTPRDFAIEFGEYLAKAAQHYMDFIGRTQSVIDPSDEYADYQRALNSAIYEFRKRAKRALATPASRAPADGWRDIASAPKDGTAVLLFVEDGATDLPYAAKWLDKNERGEGPGWFLTWDHTAFDGDTLNPPTHWMPQPAPPNAEQNRAPALAEEWNAAIEAAAKVVDGYYASTLKKSDGSARCAITRVADAIRALSSTPAEKDKP